MSDCDQEKPLLLQLAQEKVKQDFSEESRTTTHPKDYVTDAFNQLYDAGLLNIPPRKEYTVDRSFLVALLDDRNKRLDDLEKQLDQERARVAHLEHFADAVLTDLEIIDESDGVAGWHLNGEVATWEEVGLAYTRDALISARKKSSSESFTLRNQADELEN